MSGKPLNEAPYADYISILKKDLSLAMGCTEPGAVAYASAEAVTVLGKFPERLDIKCSGNIIKNVKGVIVPNSGGLRGVDSAAVLGALVGRADKKLSILENVEEKDVKKASVLLKSDFCHVHLKEGEDSLYIEAIAKGKNDTAKVVIAQSHTNIVLVTYNDETILDKQTNRKNGNRKDGNENDDKNKISLSIKGILDFAKNADINDLKRLLQLQLSVNTAIADEGLRNPYGSSVGKTLLKTCGNDIKTRAKAKAAAGSDARMGGSSMPVVINSGSGNQGITVTVPVAEYAYELCAGEEKLYRALAISNLVSIHIKNHIGKLSAFCGAVSAACGSGAAITYLDGGGYEEICSTITNTAANVSGIICDGAKASCAAKIASSIDAAIMGHEMTKSKKTFPCGEGIVKDDIEETIDNIGLIGKEGMKETDIEIMHLMLGDRDFGNC
ncbi:MAG: L-serine ammonia-lyase, iron-sulfur-dependent, subunit alpha [Eubacteriales bacterium]|nr:L-serine ammonia-lyase, iron-sulfur-dependent, subunit alpha [Eubacteriales bacterium]NLF47047.1 serine dehydratase subunit alpha family protein [Clostridiales bacterium]